MTEDPRQQDDGAPDGQQAGGPAPERAELLGTTALTARVRGACGKKQDFDREDWQWDGVVTCSACGRGILHDSLRVVSPEEAHAIVEARRPTERELRALRRMELSLRDLMSRYEEHPRWYWSPPTNRMADEVRLLLTDLDDSRHGRGAPHVAAAGPARVEAASAGGTPDEGESGEEDEEIFDDEADEEEDSPGEEE